MDLLTWAHQFKERSAWLAFLMVPNLLGIGYGYYYYYQVGQFDPASRYATDWWWWPLVGDSPGAVLLLSVALVAYRLFGWRHKVLDALAFVAMVYVGLWTTALFLLYAGEMGTFAWDRFPGNVNPLLFVSHMGMPLEALVLVRDLRRDTFSWRFVGGFLAFWALYLFVDYGPLHLHPAPFLADHTRLHVVSPLLMIVALALFWWLVRSEPRRNA